MPNIFSFNFSELENKKLKKIFVKLLCYLIYIPYLPLFILIILASPFIKIRIGYINSERIGHLTSEINTYLMKIAFSRKNENKKKKQIDLFFRSKTISNKCIYSKLVKPNLKIYSRFILFPIYKWILLFKTSHSINLHSRLQNDYEFHKKYSSYIKFNSDEIALGDKFLRSINFPINSKIALIINRDSKYLKVIFKGKNYSYNNFRNADIRTFEESVRYLIEQNYYVIRMGAIVKEELKIDSEKFFDYASSSKRSDFLDAYLFSKCAFVISVTTGVDELAKLFKKPICYVNFVILDHLRTHWKSLTTFKKIINKKTGKLLPYSYLILNELEDCQDGNVFNSNNIGFVDNTREEILYSIKEFLEKIVHNKKNFVQSKMQIDFKNSYLDKFISNGNKGFISEEFIKRNINLFRQKL